MKETVKAVMVEVMIAFLFKIAELAKTVFYLQVYF